MLRRTLAPTLIALSLLAACADPNKAASEAAIKAAEGALAPVKGEAVRYAPGGLLAIETGLTKARAAFDKGDFKGALEAAQGLPAKIAEMAATVARNKAGLQKSFADVAARIDKQLTGLTARVAELAKAKKLPKGLTAEDVKAAPAQIEDLQRMVEAARGRLAAGAINEAFTLAAPAQIGAGELLNKFGLNALGDPIPAATK